MNWPGELSLGWVSPPSATSTRPLLLLLLRAHRVFGHSDAQAAPLRCRRARSGRAPAMRSPLCAAAAARLVLLSSAGFIACGASAPCASGQFLLKSRCVPCHPACSECHGHELFQCTTCGVDEDGQERFLHQGRCRTHCPRRAYPDRGHYACLPCIANCELCTDGNICAKCLEHYKLQNGVCQMASCHIGQVQDPDTGECIDCEMGCKACSTGDPEMCNSCVEGYVLFRHQCRRHCPRSTYEDWGRGLCLSCPAPCTDCRSDTRCLVCQPGYFLHGYFLDQDSSCVVQCPSGSYANSATQLCEDCTPNCEACVGTSDNCIGCAKGSNKQFLHQGRCWLNCPEGFFETAEGSCEACDSSCLTCDGIKSQCLSCDDGYYLGSECSFLYLMLNGVCKASCPVGYYEDMEEGRCGQCHPTCGSCSGPLADDCETCSPFSPKLYKGACSKECLAGTYYETEAMECQECHQTCMSCSGPDANQCTQCEKGLALDPNTLLCGVTGDTDCPPGTYLHDDQFTCMGCHGHCYSCEGPGDDECLTCVVPKYLHRPGPESCRACAPPLLALEGTKLCVERCPHRFYKRNDICKQCHTSCQTCTDASPQSCLTCDWGSTLKDNICYPRCEEGRYLSDEETCEPCDSSCRHCTGPGPDQCLTCHRDSALHAVESRCAHCCQAGGNDTNCCVCDRRSALCVEAPRPQSGDDQESDLDMSSRALNQTSAALPISLLLALGLALAVFALVKAHARKRCCWGQSYERLSGSASINMPHGVPEPDSGDEVDVVYTSRGGSIYRRYSFIHEQDTDADQDVDESTYLNQS
ncbi:hypothetical protein F2P81_006989 [Scophthalmus maximus]|uniref:EGF-like domain-containing protein n=1 Tax=Scophthalmus maximus TaxID=52904 RepID=A0A6A4TE24_SCOMX|nr:hypothetical protein F2P81_006989 [Scophthalmus maximus]